MKKRGRCYLSYGFAARGGTARIAANPPGKQEEGADTGECRKSKYRFYERR